MTVDELIEELRKYPGDIPALVRDRDDNYIVPLVREAKLFYLGSPAMYRNFTFNEDDKKVRVVFLS